MSKKKQAAHRYGQRAEKLAGLYLRCKGYRILANRYRNHAGEIDILAARFGTLVAVEVKARQTISDCNETVPPAKQAKIARAL
ncbi:MAG: YraN family protein, partial [Rickettsiales bacterium]|nr:YraN family protein [Rickettsiales bacterium]